MAGVVMDPTVSSDGGFPTIPNLVRKKITRWIRRVLDFSPIPCLGWWVNGITWLSDRTTKGIWMRENIREDFYTVNWTPHLCGCLALDLQIRPCRDCSLRWV